MEGSCLFPQNYDNTVGPFLVPSHRSSQGSPSTTIPPSCYGSAGRGEGDGPSLSTADGSLGTQSRGGQTDRE